MNYRLPARMRKLLIWLPFATASFHLAAATDAPEAERLRQLLYGEALFHSYQQDYLTAISRLELAELQGLLPSSGDDARLLLAQMKLAYGMHLEAGFDLHALLGKDVPPAVRNRAWYELARAFSHKGYNEAAAEALENIEGELPADIVGDYQLLRATVLMALNRNLEAAQELAEWRGAPELAAYAHYNRGIALVRAGDYPQVIPALEMAVEMPARGEELLALRDKARLALGYALAREENYKQARKQLEAVRRQGPFSNRALLAIGWIDYKQGRNESALVSWTELRGRSPTDPAVLETLLVVPAVHRELNSLQTAARDYEEAMNVYTNELRQLQLAKESVENGDAVELLLQQAGESGPAESGSAGQVSTRLFGPLLASRGFLETLQGHSELQAMLGEVDRGLGEINSLPKTEIPAEPMAPSLASPSPKTPMAGDSAIQQHKDLTREGDNTPWQQDRVRGEGEQIEDPSPGIPRLPEIESPSQRTLKPLPERKYPSRPSISNYISEPPSSEITGLPESVILSLPSSGEFFGKPDSGGFLRRPGERREEDYAYPDRVPKKRAAARDTYAYQLGRLLPAEETEAMFDPGAVPVGDALRELAAALTNTTERMAGLNGAYTGEAELERRVEALRRRILALRARIGDAIALYENYTRAMALDELNRRELMLQDLLEQASLELAKTYDQSSKP